MKITYTCKVCDSQFSDFKSNKRKYCSRKCLGVSNSYSLRGNNWNLGRTAWNKGKSAPWAKNNFKNLPLVTWNKGKNFMQDEKHPLWTGNNVGYRALHIWIGNKLGTPGTCEHCGKTGLKGRQIHWANKSRKYKRNLNDWLRLCVKCHKQYDKSKDLVLV